MRGGSPAWQQAPSACTSRSTASGPWPSPASRAARSCSGSAACGCCRGAARPTSGGCRARGRTGRPRRGRPISSSRGEGPGSPPGSSSSPRHRSSPPSTPGSWRSSPRAWRLTSDESVPYSERAWQAVTALQSIDQTANHLAGSAASDAQRDYVAALEELLSERVRSTRPLRARPSRPARRSFAAWRGCARRRRRPASTARWSTRSAHTWPRRAGSTRPPPRTSRIASPRRHARSTRPPSGYGARAPR